MLPFVFHFYTEFLKTRASPNHHHQTNSKANENKALQVSWQPPSVCSLGNEPLPAVTVNLLSSIALPGYTHHHESTALKLYTAKCSLHSKPLFIAWLLHQNSYLCAEHGWRWISQELQWSSEPAFHLWLILCFQNPSCSSSQGLLPPGLNCIIELLHISYAMVEYRHFLKWKSYRGRVPTSEFLHYIFPFERFNLMRNNFLFLLGEGKKHKKRK